ncbi:MGH1-like glycoside hydrolase domain-containing protein [Blautia producta]|uniref:MGH1-like glycoside hydrolase domain-containing protein n=1 Tax=Blautia producta TaxID=33035 RepID=UPI0031B56DB5
MSETDMIEKYVEKFNQQDEELLSQYISNEKALLWMTENIPVFECSDCMAEETYYFRWWVYRKHIKSTSEGFIITEFLPDVYWAGKYNSINCAAGHHIAEGRWLRNGEKYLEDYIYFWLRGSGDVHSYSTWIADAIYQYCMVKGDFTIALEMLPDLIENYYQWEKTNKHSSGLFWSIDDRDAMECSISGNGLRPTLNSYMYADACAIARIAGKKGDRTHEKEFQQKAEKIKQLVQDKLWDPKAGFFKVFPLGSAKEPVSCWDFSKIAKERNVREEIGLIPWCFHLPDAGYEKAWLQVVDPRGFQAPYGPTTAEQRHPQFMCRHEHECLWNGPSWPFATTQTLTAMANLLKDYEQTYISEKDFSGLFEVYTNSHFRTLESGERINWIDENLDPYTGEWLSRNILEKWKWRKEKGGYERGKDYNHSAYCDLVIHKIFGIEPQDDGSLLIRPLIPQNWEYCRLERVRCQGREIAVSYDKDGTHFHEGKGFRVWCDGVCIHESDNIEEVRYGEVREKYESKITSV